MIKVFGIGNILLGDDGIGVKVVEKLKEEIENISSDINVIVGETDYLYCLNKIEEEDIVVIIDSTYLNINPGFVSYLSFKNCDRFCSNLIFQHESNLLNVLLTEKPNIKGYLIGIEVRKLEFSLELSKTLKDNFDCICLKVIKYIKEIYTDYARGLYSI